MKRFFAALSFLTLLPVPASWCGSEEDLRRSPACYPLVGLAIGLFAAFVAVDATWLFPPLCASALVVAALAAASGALHLDGLADTADGFLSSRPRERILEIMKDSRIGTMGAVALVGVLGLKAVALAGLPGPELWRAALLIPIAGRCGMLLAMSILPYARPEGGLGSLFFQERAPGRAAWAVAFALISGGVVAGWVGCLAAALALGGTLAFAACCRQKIGGATGDTLGATGELCEVLAALAFAAGSH